MRRKSQMVRADETREYIHSLLAQGGTLNAISRACGVNDSTVSSINTGRTNFTTREIATKIMSVQGVPCNRLVTVSAIGSARRLRALSTLGHPMRIIADATGVSTIYLQKIHGHRKDVISDRVRDSITAAYGILVKEPGPSNHVRAMAALHGCLPPEAWREVDIDDPHAQPWGVLAA